MRASRGTRFRGAVVLMMAGMVFLAKPRRAEAATGSAYGCAICYSSACDCGNFGLILDCIAKGGCGWTVDSCFSSQGGPESLCPGNGCTVICAAQS